MGAIDRPWQDRDSVLIYFEKQRKRAVEKYERFVEEGVKKGRRPQLVWGGLIQSLGGWSRGVSSRRVGDKTFHDKWILGSGDFASVAIRVAEAREKITLRPQDKKISLEALAGIVRDKDGIKISEFRSGYKGKRLTQVFCQVARRKMEYSGVEIGWYLRITTSVVNCLAM